jgi:hypothetical protein
MFLYTFFGLKKWFFSCMWSAPSTQKEKEKDRGQFKREKLTKRERENTDGWMDALCKLWVSDGSIHVGYQESNEIGSNTWNGLYIDRSITDRRSP